VYGDLVHRTKTPGVSLSELLDTIGALAEGCHKIALNVGFTQRDSISIDCKFARFFKKQLVAGAHHTAFIASELR
jgi:hypothetical protein